MSPTRCPYSFVVTLLALVVGTTGLAGCAEEKSESPGSALVSIREGLTFEFGTSTPCYASDGSSGSRTITCDDLGSTAAPSVKVFPPVAVELAPFAIEATEVTNAQYKRCASDGPCKRPEGLGELRIDGYYDGAETADHPVIGVTLAQARVYCAWLGRRLPTEFEWERVAGGDAGGPDRGARFILPLAAADVRACLGEDLAIGYCNPESSGTRAVGTSGADAVAVGDGVVYDLAGNVAEMTDTVFAEDLTCAGPIEGCGNCFSCGESDPQCKQTCNDCPVCTEPENDCFVQCPGRGPGLRGFPICLRYPEGEILQGPTGPGSGDIYSVRGGHYGAADSTSCQLRVSDRSQQIRTTLISTYSKVVGFRCAAEPPPLGEDGGSSETPDAGVLPGDEVTAPPGDEVTDAS